MDGITRLVEAAQTGNVEFLLKLIEDDPLMLQKVALVGAETPLHIASMVGHLNFVQEIVKLREEFARELNQDGFSPLHIASANGYVEIVKELLKIDHNLCLLKGKERKIPLHCAAIKGRIHVMKDLLAASPLSVEEVTTRGETALHLAIKNNQFDVLTILVEHLNEFQKEDVLNKKDEQGNTILHLSVSRKQHEVVQLLLGEQLVAKGAVEVNSVNKNGLTALDVLLVFQSEAGDREIEEILRQAGAIRASVLHSTPIQAPISQNEDVAINPSNNQAVSEEQVLSPAEQMLSYFKYDKDRDSPDEVRNALLVVATLMATATYQAVLSPPGGLWQEDSFSDKNVSGTIVTTKLHAAGEAVMGSKSTYYYILFLLFNSIGFFLSLIMISILTSGFPLRLEFILSIVAIAITYDASMITITPKDSALSILFVVISIVTPVAIPIATMLARNYLKRPRNPLQFTNLQTSV